MMLPMASMPPSDPSFRRVPFRDRPLATYALIGANVLLFALEMLWGGAGMVRDGVTLALSARMGANLGRSALWSEPWRVLSSAFLHANGLHISMNMWALFVFGVSLERFWRPARFLVLYGAAAAAGGIFSALLRSREIG